MVSLHCVPEKAQLEPNLKLKPACQTRHFVENKGVVMLHYLCSSHNSRCISTTTNHSRFQNPNTCAITRHPHTISPLCDRDLSVCSDAHYESCNWQEFSFSKTTTWVFVEVAGVL